MAASQPHISLAAEHIGSLAGWPITNSLLLTWVVMILLALGAYAATKKISAVPGNVQSIAEIVLGGIYDLFKSVVGEHYINRFFPLLATIFLFVAVANWSGLLPGVGSISIAKPEDAAHAQLPSLVSKAVAATETHEEETVPVEAGAYGEERPDSETHEETAGKDAAHASVPLLRGPTADLNTTLALAIIAVVSVQYYGLVTLGGAYLKKFFNFSDPIMFGVGLLEIVSEISRIMSFAFRLFGNIFAGEVLLTVIAFLMPVIAPLPFLGLELFVGFIQALVFSMLTAVFLSMATVSHEH